LEEHFSEQEAQRQIDTALHWGRYVELFSYDSETDRLVLPIHAGAKAASEEIQK
jgi:NitT/TauT family transport system ATP-binding protein